VVVFAYLLGFVFFTDSFVQMERWTMVHPWRIVWFLTLLAIEVIGIHFYREQLLDMDKELIFEDVPASEF
jgi:hypothetical protein